MKGIQAAHGRDLAIAEKSRAGLVAQSLGERHGILVLFPEEPRAASQTGKQQGAEGLITHGAGGFERPEQILHRRLAVADLVLERLAHAGNSPDHHRARVGVRTENIFDEKIPRAEIIEVFRAGEAREEIAARVGFFAFRERLESALQNR